MKAGNFEKYLTADYADDRVTFSTLPAFANYEEEQIETQMTISLEFTCRSETKTVIFRLNINEVNNYAPTFNLEGYEIFIPTPLFPGLDVTMFLVRFSSDSENQII